MCLAFFCPGHLATLSEFPESKAFTFTTESQLLVVSIFAFCSFPSFIVSMAARTPRENNRDRRSERYLRRRFWWSVWREAIVPNNVAEADDGGSYTPRNRRPGVATHYYNNKTTQALQNGCDDGGTCCGVYELKVVGGETEAVVYIGSTYRRSAMSLYRRLSEYMRDGSHIRRIIQRALDLDFAIHVRWLKLSQELCPAVRRGERLNYATAIENRCLDSYNYAWNQRNNGNRREIHDINVLH